MINLIIRPVTSHVLRSIVGRPPNARKPSFSPLSLFANGEQGAWYDPSDTTTLFQDSAGTIPVTASGQPVGLMLDKSGRGHHATQPTAGRRPIYRRGDSRGVVNLLTWSEAFDNAAWPLTGIGLGDKVVAPDGSLSATKLVPTAGAGNHFTTRGFTVADNTTVTLSFFVKRGEYRYFVLQGKTKDNQYPAASFDLDSGIARPGSTAGSATSGMELTQEGFYRCWLTWNVLSGASGLQFFMSCRGDSGSPSVFFTGDGKSGAYIWRAQLNLGPTALDYQRNDYHLGGVATGASTDLHWLETDGVDDGMVTGNIDFTGTDKVSVFAGVRKLSDAATGVFCELSADGGANNGSFTIAAPTASLAGGSFSYNLRGSTLAAARITGYVAPTSRVLSCKYDIVQASAVTGILIRVDGAPVRHDSVVTAGTGNFGNYPLYLFSRGVTSIPFNGWFYGLAITGRLTTDAETVATERFLGKKTAVVIP